MHALLQVVVINYKDEDGEKLLDMIKSWLYEEGFFGAGRRGYIFQKGIADYIVTDLNYHRWSYSLSMSHIIPDCLKEIHKEVEGDQFEVEQLKEKLSLENKIISKIDDIIIEKYIVLCKGKSRKGIEHYYEGTRCVVFELNKINIVYTLDSYLEFNKLEDLLGEYIVLIDFRC